MLHNSFFAILKQEEAQGSIKALLSINKAHEILKGHFPGQPVVPGVCMMQMIKELVELHMNKDLSVKEADNMKFLAVIDPEKNNEVEADVSYIVEDGNIILHASLFSGTVTFFKLKATLAFSG
jgi:3-hydroxyacyl-[acyl-carrier-protein] dehydratase